MIDELFELIVGENGFVVTLRCDSRFDEEKYCDIKEKLYILILQWKRQNDISKKASIAIIELIECLVGGNKFLSENDTIKVEDAFIEIKDIINELYETL